MTEWIISAPGSILLEADPNDELLADEDGHPLIAADNSTVWTPVLPAP
ncbi:MAG: hypothetical protein JOZ27_02145 [Caulobacteraceae bacterium]|nr:hypothetical protein [Caulobacteraceae bacterium]